MLLARKGVAVTVLERAQRVGGRSASFDMGGFRFDCGPTFFLYPQILAGIFSDCGLDLAEEVELRRIEPMYELFFEDAERLLVSQDVERMQAELRRLNPEDATNLPKLLREGRQKLQAFTRAFQIPFTSLSAFLDPGILAALPHLKPHLTVDQDLARHFSDPRIRLAFSFQSKYLGMSPYKCPSLFTILSFLEHEYGVFHPLGGCGTVMEKMAECAQRLGAEIRLGEPVERLEFDGRRVTAVHTREGRYPGDAIVVNADFANTMTNLVPDELRRRWTDRKLERKKFSCSTYMLYLGLKGEVDLNHHTIFLANDYRRNLADIEGGRLTPQPSFYVQNACRTDPGLAPPGHSTLYVLVPVPNLDAPVDWQSEAPRYRQLVLDRLGKLGLHDLERRIVVERAVTPADWHQDFQLHKGATFNLAHQLSQMLYWRPHNRFEDLEGVYLVGGGTHPGSGLPVIFEGARISVGLLERDLALPQRLVEPARRGFTEAEAA